MTLTCVHGQKPKCKSAAFADVQDVGYATRPHRQNELLQDQAPVNLLAEQGVAENVQLGLWPPSGFDSHRWRYCFTWMSGAVSTSGSVLTTALAWMVGPTVPYRAYCIVL